METKCVCHGLISSYAKFDNNRTMWTNFLFVKFCRRGEGKRAEALSPPPAFKILLVKFCSHYPNVQKIGMRTIWSWQTYFIFRFNLGETPRYTVKLMLMWGGGGGGVMYSREPNLKPERKLFSLPLSISLYIFHTGRIWGGGGGGGERTPLLLGFDGRKKSLIFGCGTLKFFQWGLWRHFGSFPVPPFDFFWNWIYGN